MKKHAAVIAAALALGACSAGTSEPIAEGPYVANGKEDHILVEPMEGPSITIPYEGFTMNLHTREDVWGACIEAADVLSEGDITPDENGRLTEHCELALRYLED